MNVKPWDALLMGSESYNTASIVSVILSLISLVACVMFD